MSCPAFELLSAEVDGQAGADVKQHLLACGGCRARNAELLLLKAAIRGAAVRSLASDALKARMKAAATRSRSMRAARWALGAAAVIAVVVALLARSSAPDSQLAVQLVGDHVLITLNGGKPPDVVGSDPQAIQRFFEGKLDFAVMLPVLQDARLTGARLCSIGGRRVALAFYECRGHRLSLFVIHDRASGASCMEGVQGFTVCRRAAQGLDYVLVGDLPAAQAEQLLSAGVSALH